MAPPLRGLWLILAALVLSSTLTQPALAYLTGNDYKEYCTAEQHLPKSGACLGYFVGFVDTIRLLEHTLGSKVLCDIPIEITPAQLRAMILGYMDKHPERLHWNAATIILNMMNEAFPCEHIAQ